MKKVIVIGAGILGASTAYHLAKAGADVTVIDRHDPGQATDAAAGIICPWLTQRRNKAWYALAKGGAAYYSSLIRQLQEDGEIETGYARLGALSLHTDLGKLAKMEERALMRREDAPEIGEIEQLDPGETARLFPPVSEEFSSIYVSGAARVDGRAIKKALVHAAGKHGARFVKGSAQLLLKEGRVIGAEVDGVQYDAETVIVTAGAWAPELFEPLGITLNVTAQKGQIVHLQLENCDTVDWPVVMPPSDQYILAFDDGKIVVGTTHEEDKAFDMRITAGGLREVLGKALISAPGLADAAFTEARVGYRPYTPGFLPVVGAVPGYSNLLFANGLGASGLTVGPFLGAQLAKLALGQELEIDLGLYSVEGAIEE
ncbi:FAD-binding oxidoreductase [Neobacillus notoginsengisoli]|uniref:FAD-binding oxidoreductase n=1 Tax=Neobacillus notoginsengisoli TaxID=1578198 RepID=A0A417YTD8_9BACI|nr:FAD-binding oxidoreductase [Neobacillus notoginsengisoli]RHW40312.1 FAD-binding oxidoreductase [Neobacillus notoginsengisoli]